jgi:dihydroorotase-like cyclic amidohydrolase
MPNTKPVTDNQARRLREAKGEAAGFARVYPYGAISVGQKGETLAEFGEMVAAGAVAVQRRRQARREVAPDAHRARVRAHLRRAHRRALRGHDARARRQR